MSLASEAEVQEVLSAMKGSQFTVAEVREKERLRNPAPPFITSSLQQEAARKLGFRASKTMSVAQQLYEGVELGKEGTVGLNYLYENGFHAYISCCARGSKGIYHGKVRCGIRA